MYETDLMIAYCVSPFVSQKVRLTYSFWNHSRVEGVTGISIKDYFSCPVHPAAGAPNQTIPYLESFQSIRKQTRTSIYADGNTALFNPID